MRTFFRKMQDAHIDVTLLSAYLDGEVTAEEHTHVESHLHTCATCRNELASLRATVDMLHALPRAPLPRAFTLSEAQVGIRRPGATLAWWGNTLRGLAGAAALLLVVVAAAVVLRQSRWATAPEFTAARVAPAPVTTAVPEAALRSSAAEAPATADDRAARPLAEVAVPASPPQAAAEPTASVPAIPAEPAVDAAGTSPVEPVAAAATSVEPAAAEPLSMSAAPAAMAVPTDGPDLTAERGLTSMAVAASPGSIDGRDSGPAATVAEMGAETPVARLAAPTDSSPLPAGTAVAYSDGETLWAWDGELGLRPVARAGQLVALAISPDRAWIAYQAATPTGAELWVVSWHGGEPRRLVTEADLARDKLPPGYRERQMRDFRWIHGQPALAVSVVVTPTVTDAPARLELWHVDVESGSQRLLTSGDARHEPAFAPDGTRLAIFRYEPERSARGSLYVVNTDDAAERVVLRFPASPEQRSFNSQIGWEPNSRSFWAAIPVTDANARASSSGVTLYRVPADQGVAQAVGYLEAYETFWSPAATRLAFTRRASQPTGAQLLFLADPDGSLAQRYATLEHGRFIGWAADDTQFLYEEAGQLYLGTVGQAPRSLNIDAQVTDARWLTPQHIVYLAQEAEHRRLAVYSLTGTPADVAFLPPAGVYDAHSR